MRIQPITILLLLSLSLCGCVSKQPCEEEIRDFFAGDSKDVVPAPFPWERRERWACLKDDIVELTEWLESRHVAQDGDTAIPEKMAYLAKCFGLRAIYVDNTDETTYMWLTQDRVQADLPPEPYGRLESICRTILADSKGDMRVRLLALDVLHVAESVKTLPLVQSFFHEAKGLWESNGSPDDAVALARAARAVLDHGDLQGLDVCESLFYGDTVSPEAKWIAAWGAAGPPPYLAARAFASISLMRFSWLMAVAEGS